MNCREYSLGIDLGGTNTVVGIVDDKGFVLRKREFSTATPSPQDWRDKVLEIIEELTAISGDIKIKGIGIGAPCANALTGSIEAATDLPWPSPIPLKELLKEKTELPVYVTNDANAAAIGEMVYGVAKGFDNFIVLTLGTGVGSGIVCDRHLLSGSRGFAGELGHMTFSFASDRECGCGRKGCLQTVASAKGVVETALRLIKDCRTKSSLRDIPVSELSSKLIAEEANKGDQIALETFKFTGECLGKAAAEFASISDPEAIILFGGVAKAGNLILEPMIRSFRQNALHLYKDHTRIMLSGLNEADAAVLGAASLAYQ